MTELTQDYLKSLVRYEDGRLWWIKPKINRRLDKPAGGFQKSQGYNRLKIDGVLYYEHRLVWLFHYGRWPEGEIDHINGKRADNRIENLREATRVQQNRNMKLFCQNTSGHTGVSWSKHAKKWYARIRVSVGRDKNLGYFSDINDAIAARKAAEQKYGYHPNHGRPQ